MGIFKDIDHALELAYAALEHSVPGDCYGTGPSSKFYWVPCIGCEARKSIAHLWEKSIQHADGIARKEWTNPLVICDESNNPHMYSICVTSQNHTNPRLYNPSMRTGLGDGPLLPREDKL